METRKVPRPLTWCIRSQRFISVASVPVSEMAEALLTQMSIPPKRSAVAATAAVTGSSSRTSTTKGSALPPAFSIASAAVWMVPGNFGCGSAVLAGDRHIGAIARGPQHDRQADAAAGAADEQRLAGQAHRLTPVVSSDSSQSRSAASGSSA